MKKSQSNMMKTLLFELKGGIKKDLLDFETY